MGSNVVPHANSFVGGVFRPRMVPSGTVVSSAASAESAWNPTDKAAEITLSESNRLATAGPGPGACAVRGSGGQDAATANAYFEVQCVSTTYNCFGISKNTAPTSSPHTASADGYFLNYDGKKIRQSVTAVYGSAPATGNIIGVLLKNGALYIAINNVWQGGGDPVAETGAAYAGITGVFYPTAVLDANGDKARIRTITSQFSYTPPSGSSQWG